MKRIRLACVEVMIEAGISGSGPLVGLGEEHAERSDQEPEDHRADDRPEHPRSAADEQHRVGEEGDVGGEERRADRRPTGARS